MPKTISHTVGGADLPVARHACDIGDPRFSKGLSALDDAALKAALDEAADTLRALPRVTRSARLTAWPEVVQDSVSLMAASDGGRTRPPAPSPRAIDRMDVVLAWLLVCQPEERRILWARACKIPWRRLEDLDGRSHTTLRQIAGRGLNRIRRHLRGVL